MAKKNTQVQNASILPDGFENARPDVAGAYFRFAEGSELRGILIGRFSKPGRGQAGFIYQVQATAPCKAFVRNPDDDGDDYIVEEVEAGTVVSIDEKASLKCLKTLCEDDNHYEVVIRCLEKKALDGGRTFWDCAVGKRVVQLSNTPF